MSNESICKGCGRQFKGPFGLRMHQAAPEQVEACRPAAFVTEVEAAPAITEFHTDDFRKVGAEAQFSPKWMTRPTDKKFLGITVRVVKVNPKTILVETELGQRITTDAWMLVPADKPFVRSDAERIVLGSIVRLNARQGLYVVVSVKIGEANVAMLGGNENRYVKVRDISTLTVVDPKDVLQ